MASGGRGRPVAGSIAAVDASMAATWCVSVSFGGGGLRMQDSGVATCRVNTGVAQLPRHVKRAPITIRTPPKPSVIGRCAAAEWPRGLAAGPIVGVESQAVRWEVVAKVHGPWDSGRRCTRCELQVPYPTEPLAPQEK